MSLDFSAGRIIVWSHDYNRNLMSTLEGDDGSYRVLAENLNKREIIFKLIG
jgi:hypothetical protein